MQRTLPSIKLANAMTRRGIDLPALSKAIGRAPWTVDQIVKGNRFNKLITRSIEFALNAAIWSTPALFQFRKRVVRWYGVNIYTEAKESYQTKVRERGIAVTCQMIRRPELEARLEAHFMKHNPTIKRPL